MLGYFLELKDGLPDHFSRIFVREALFALHDSILIGFVLLKSS